VPVENPAHTLGIRYGILHVPVGIVMFFCVCSVHLVYTCVQCIVMVRKK
jgi:hypothetical protein